LHENETVAKHFCIFFLTEKYAKKNKTIGGFWCAPILNFQESFFSSFLEILEQAENN